MSKIMHTVSRLHMAEEAKQRIKQGLLVLRLASTAPQHVHTAVQDYNRVVSLQGVCMDEKTVEHLKDAALSEILKYIEKLPAAPAATPAPLRNVAYTIKRYGVEEEEYQVVANSLEHVQEIVLTNLDRKWWRIFEGDELVGDCF